MKDNKRKVVYDISIAVLALVASIIVIVQILNDSIPEYTDNILNIIDNVIWVIFVIDYIVRLVSSESKIDFVKNNKIDLISILPFNSILKALRIFKIFRVFKLTKLLKLAKLLRLTSLILRFKKNGWKFVKTNNFQYVLTATVSIIIHKT